MMKAKLIFLLKYYLFWVVISIVAKIMFLFYQWSDTTHLSAADFWHILAGITSVRLPTARVKKKRKKGTKKRINNPQTGKQVAFVTGEPMPK